MIFKKSNENTAKNHEQKIQEPKPQVKKKMATLRLQKDIQHFKEEKITFVTMSFPQQQSLQIINIAIQPQQQSLYTNCKINFQITFPDTYPIDPPKIKSLNKIFHPNITFEGAVCLPLVRQDYAPTVTLTMIICGLIYILTYPNGQDALATGVGDIMQKQPEMFPKIVEYTKYGRQFQNRLYDNITLK